MAARDSHPRPARLDLSLEHPRPPTEDPPYSETPNASSHVLRGRLPYRDSHRAATSPSPSPGHTRSQTLPAVTPTFNGAKAIRRKPLSSTASQIAASYGSPVTSPSALSPGDLPMPETRFSRSYSVDSPTIYEYPDNVRPLFAPPAAHQKLDTLSLASSPPPAGTADDAAYFASRNIPSTNLAAPQTKPSDGLSEPAYLTADVTPTFSPKFPKATPKPIIEEEEEDTDDSESTYSHHTNENSIMSTTATKPTPPHLNLQQRRQDSLQTVTTVLEAPLSLTPTTYTTPTPTPSLNKPLPRSPGSSKLANFFGWGGSPSPSTTEFSSLSSPLASPRRATLTDDTPLTTGVPSLLPEPTKGNATPTNALGYCESHLHTPPASSLAPSIQIEEMEDELKAISAELASSIRREMDLEDLVDRLQSEINNPTAPGKRTSDYFSDSGYSSAKFSEYDQNKEEIEKIQRRAEQEKASMRLELTNKLQEERTRRGELDLQIKELAEKASQIDLAQLNSADANSRLKDLEHTCEDLRRRLGEEIQVKSNFEDLLSVLKVELQSATNERDNLRDEIVPQLKAKLEGLEAEASEYANLTYESSKMQQELEVLKQENKALKTSGQQPQLQQDTRSRSSTMRSAPRLSRSSSVTAAPFVLQKAPMGLTRSNTVKSGVTESREQLSERLKDVEAQRDALHNALKSLLERQEFQNRENEKKIKTLEVERDRLMASSPRKAGFEKDISNLRIEINVLRRRAEEAAEQKWQVEKGLAGLKMDLDRAEGEVAALRGLLKERDILIPPSMARASMDHPPLAAPVTSESLEAAFKDLQLAYQESLLKIKDLEAHGPLIAQDESTQLAIHRLEQSLTSAVFERDAAKEEASAYKDQLESLASSEVAHLESERALADELRTSAQRVEDLAAQVQNQLSINAELRQRLAEAVARGDADRKANADRITRLQSRLKNLEEQLQAAQAASEERVARHEEQLRELKDAQSAQLRRMSPSPVGRGLRSPRKTSLSPMPSPMFPRSPRLMPKQSVEDETQIERLRAKVVELETALTNADSEMQDVIARMSSAQIEVLTLQEEREAARRETRRIQQELEKERVKAFEDRFKTLSGSVP
ncbi:intracellular protein transport-like protein [Colletotrichum sojae]|uniref:Intracellular protein transport-like protein n=1 Tax=Colletotrichum sojae TaxID=2175907 RepID=A0A8H6JJW6_9PEZI|nr:intracellular protein transport-like protein [Colletotrichum sojae]